MDLWIRNQNKMNLVKCDTFIIATSKTHHLNTADNLYHIISIINSAGYADLGAYKTKERALEILDDIHHNVLENNIEEELSYEQADIKLKNIIANNMIKIYNMPED